MTAPATSCRKSEKPEDVNGLAAGGPGPAGGPPVSFWRRRVVGPLAAQMRQGITPEKLALTIALGVVLGCFPILGAATLLCTTAGMALKLNQPVIQATNQAVYPLQLLLLIPHYRAGEWLFRVPPVPLSIPMLRERFAADWQRFLQDYGLLALQGIAVWCLLAPVAGAAIYFAVRGPLRVLSGGLAR